MKILVTGGAGFIGRWVVKRLLTDHHQVTVLDNFSSGREANIKAFISHPNFQLIEGDIKDQDLIETIFMQQKFDLCYHLAACINVQDSIDAPRTTIENDVMGTFNVLEACRQYGTKMVFMSTCMVYAPCPQEGSINEEHPVRPASPYAAAKLAGEHLTLSYYYTYGLPVVVVRPFNTYGPFQKTNGEGGVIAIFLNRALKGETLKIYGTGNQTRDFLYVEDCANFVARAGLERAAEGRVLNAGTGRDITINSLAAMIASVYFAGDREQVLEHVPHIHPQSEIDRLRCDYNLASRILNWHPTVDLEKGLQLTMEWIRTYTRNL
ncbi:UDP-glucose 4-epimerase [Moorella thermoacetica]|uniref:UDP-glucose 4-epimerase n=1 Tax=Neomoorella thermoacetica TaxID=1525 RepID=A0AAC9HGU3_NEOTH|nr:GDP-mannose 4,6-dehydratase [Moorella thermoacetica]AOQ23403.1 UDP-glucose 4-epimerase [Moorella thermoacetica]TYL06936.1 UDP-glucose 4-epimerase [Moorella thermoacetica]